jgi:hypothetical protein
MSECVEDGAMGRRRPSDRPLRKAASSDPGNGLADEWGSRPDVVGSLLRPPELLGAQRRRATGELAAEELASAEDRAVDWTLALQEESLTAALDCRLMVPHTTLSE